MNRKELKREYKDSMRPMGIYQIRNLVNEKVFVGSSMNLKGIFNRRLFQLELGGDQSKSLQKDWNEFGKENFAFEVLEEIFPRENPVYDYRSDLECLEDLWLEKLEPYGAKGYNERKKTREERLQMISANRSRRYQVVNESL
jgi:group I intron endonuclease